MLQSLLPTAFQSHEEEYYLVEALISQGAATGTQLVESMGYAETARMEGAAAKNQRNTKSHEYSQFGTVENGRGEEYEKFLKEGSKEGLTDAEKYGIARVDMKSGSTFKYYNPDGSPIWPPNRGFEGNSTTITLEPGTLVDRYGYDGGTFVSPKGTPYTERALPIGTDKKPYTVFEVVKPVEVQAGKITPWFGEKGGVNPQT